MPDVEDHLRRAMQEGKFDDLEGKGKPLHLDENPLEDPEWRMAHHLLQEGGFTLPWIELRREIDAEIEAARADLRRAWEWRQAAIAENQPVAMAEEEWGRAGQRFSAQVELINKRIFDYNLQAPSGQLQRMKLNVEREIEIIKSVR